MKVKEQGKKTFITTYALLDNGSNETFCTNNLLKQLGVEVRKCNISVSTVNNAKGKQESIISTLEVADDDENFLVGLPMVFSTSQLPVSEECIPKQEDVARWPYLINVRLPKEADEQKANLLIGLDVPEALQPEEIRKGQQGGPFAVRTKFGWTLNGPLQRNEMKSKQCYLLNVMCSDNSLNEQLHQYFNQDFNECLADDRKMMSLEDRKALLVYEESALVVNHHYQIAIPWRSQKPCLPNNRAMTEHPLKHLRRRLVRDLVHRKKYSKFIEDLQTRNYAEKIPNEQIDSESGVVWYLPHHSVTHPKKLDKVRVVFDCAAKYHSTFL